MNRPTANQARQSTGRASRLHAHTIGPAWLRWSFASMSAIPRLFSLLAFTAYCLPASGNSYDMPLSEKVQFCAVVAEVRVDAVQTRRDDVQRLDELVCECTIIQGFKMPFVTNKLRLTFYYLTKQESYAGKTFLVFAFEHERGYRPYGGQAGLVEKGHAYADLVPPKEAGGAYSYRKLNYDGLVQQIKAITKANQQGGANGRQPFRSEANQTSAAVASRRSP